MTRILLEWRCWQCGHLLAKLWLAQGHVQAKCHNCGAVQSYRRDSGQATDDFGEAEEIVGELVDRGYSICYNDSGG